MNNKLNFDICFFGTPHGFEQATVHGGFSLDLIRVLEFDITKFDPSPGEKFLRVVERSIAGDFYRFISIYTSAQEKDSSRPGGYCGVCLILKNTNSPDPTITLRVLDELLNSLYSIGTNNGKFLFKITQIFTKIPIPNDFKTLTNNLITSDAPAYQKLTNNTLLLTTGEGMSFPNPAYALSYVCNSYLASRFLDVCVIPSVRLANKIASKPTENIIDFISSSRIVSNSDRKLLLDYSDTKLKNNSLQSSLTSAEKALEVSNQKIKSLEHKIELLSPKEVKRDPSADKSNPSNLVPNPSDKSTTLVKVAPRAEIKSSLNNRTSAKNSPTSQVSDSETSLFSLFVIFCCSVVIFSLAILAGDAIFNDGSTLANIRKNYFNDPPIKKTNIQNQPVQPLGDAELERGRSQVSQVEVNKNLVDQVKTQKEKIQCSSWDQPKLSYLFTPTGSTKDGLSELAENIALDFCPPLNGCQSQLLQLLRSKNPELIDAKDLKGNEVKVDIISSCDVKDQRFKAASSKQAKKNTK